MKIPSIGETFEDLEYPEWEQQPNEKPKLKHMFDLFCAHGGSIRHWARDMKGSQKDSKFHDVKVLYKPYAEDNLRKLATKHFYLKRREAKESYENEYRNKKFDEIDRRTDIDRYQKADDAEVATAELLEQKLANEEINGTQTKDFVTALNGYQEYKKKLRKEDDTLKMEANVNATTEVKSDSPIELNFEKAYQNLIEDTIKNSTHLQGK